MRARQQDADEQAAHYPADSEGIDVVRKSAAASTVPAKLKDSELPVISAMEYDDMDTAKGLIEEAVMLKEQADAVKEARDLVNERLASLAQAYGMKHGMRHGQTAIRMQFGQTRKSLDKGMLLLNGCPAEAIAKSYKDSKPFDVVTVVDMSKVMGNGTADD